MPDDDIQLPYPFGNIIPAAQAVTKFILDDCHAPWYIYIETLLPAAGQMILELLTPSFGEVVETFLEPGGGRTFRRSGRDREAKDKADRKRGRKKGRRLPHLIPDVDELISNRLPGRALMRERAVSTGVRHLWRVFNVIERAQYQAMIIDMSADLIANWFSLLYETSTCAHNPSCRLQKLNSHRAISFGRDTWQAVVMGHTVLSIGPVHWALYGECLDMPFHASATITLEDVAPGYHVEFALQDYDTGEHLSTATAGYDPNTGLTTDSAVVATDIPRGHRVQLIARANWTDYPYPPVSYGTITADILGYDSPISIF